MYLAMHLYVQLYAGAISKLLYGFGSVREDSPLAKARGLSSLTEAQTIVTCQTVYPMVDPNIPRNNHP